MTRDHEAAPAVGMRDLLRNLVRLYTVYSPLRRGKDRLREVLKPIIEPRTRTILTTTIPYHQKLRVFTGEWVSDQIFYFGCFERELVTMLAEALRPGMVFLDVGAHVGLYSVVAATRVGAHGKVYAFEASSETFGVLVGNVAENAHFQIECVHGTVSDRHPRR